MPVPPPPPPAPPPGFLFSSSGLIGRSWSMLFAAADFDVEMYDIDEKQLQGAMAEVRTQLAELERLGLLRGKLSAEQQFSNIRTTSEFEDCVRGAFYECVPENIELKNAVHTRADAVMSDTCILASSTSALLPSRLAADIKHKNRFIVAHPTNPPFYAPLVELVPSPWTDSDVVPSTKALMEKIGQVPVVLKKEIEGFVLNRIQYSIMREGWGLIKDGIVDVDGIDKVMSAGLGRRYAFMGPFETAHLNADGMKNYADRYATMIEGVMSTLKSNDRFGGPVLEQIRTELEARIPLCDLQERRQWRDRRLAALTQLNQRIDAEDAK
ncbi:CRYL1-like protein [Mya arenaria]|uniref:CRYL1-like protein n=1 Tax=Mya arenaria TaxID=6604 RepID=A0ABY7E9N4_MYAAR|nr:CRYL1-like protein [Mya arenaria]